MIMRRLFLKEQALKMVWEVSRENKKSYLAGTAHFFPYNFRGAINRYVANADTVLLEGPLDENNMGKVIERGVISNNDSSLEKILDKRTIKEINNLEYNVTSTSYVGMYLQTFGRSPENSLFEQIKNQRPWMAFFNIWFYYRAKRGWGYKMDVDAMDIAKRLGKDVRFIETIDEQIDALNGIPTERITGFLKKIDEWDGYAKRYVKLFLKGDLEGLMSGARDFPTYCDSIIERRDPVLYERMKPFFEKGSIAAFVGISHVKGIRERLVRDGFRVEQV